MKILFSINCNSIYSNLALCAFLLFSGGEGVRLDVFTVVSAIAVFGPPVLSEASMISGQSTRPSVPPSITPFSQDWLITFSDFLHEFRVQ